MKTPTLNFFLFCIFFIKIGVNLVSAQDNTKSKHSVKIAIGVAINDGQKENGTGFIYSLGWQKHFGKKNKLRVNPNLTFGQFTSKGISDIRDQYYNSYLLETKIHYDLIRFKAFSLVTSAGVFTNYTSGLLGLGGWPGSNNRRSEYFNELYFGGIAAVGLKINPKNRKIAYELTPINLHLGNKGFLLESIKIGICLKL